MKNLIIILFITISVVCNAQDIIIQRYVPDTIARGSDTLSVFILYLSEEITNDGIKMYRQNFSKAERIEKWVKLRGEEGTVSGIKWHSGNQKTIIDVEYWLNDVRWKYKVKIDNKRILDYWLNPYTDN